MTLCNNGGIITSTSPTVRSGAFTVNVKGLSGNTTYYFRGYATNSAGTGYSADDTFLTLPSTTVATSPTDVTTTGFTANWTAPSGNGTISGYNLCVQDQLNNGVPRYDCRLVSAPATSQAVTGLNPKTTYHYQVNANNGSGLSSNSNTISVTTSD